MSDEREREKPSVREEDLIDRSIKKVKTFDLVASDTVNLQDGGGGSTQVHGDKIMDGERVTPMIEGTNQERIMGGNDFEGNIVAISTPESQPMIKPFGPWMMVRKPIRKKERFSLGIGHQNNSRKAESGKSGSRFSNLEIKEVHEEVNGTKKLHDDVHELVVGSTTKGKELMKKESRVRNVSGGKNPQTRNGKPISTQPTSKVIKNGPGENVGPMINLGINPNKETIEWHKKQVEIMQNQVRPPDPPDKTSCDKEVQVLSQEYRGRRYMMTDVLFPCCGIEEESTLHAIRDCLEVQNVWLHFLPPTCRDIFMELNLEQ
ncbi:hypothetical protein RIF29_15817 [Crotalaria pallida]|uniref:Uncharacterized protein n=1 Tax=Crotalaria pallida TaxID=3830 RepID=A0AAN9IF03_CROPI